jgi:predicted RNA binding protein YcfA (HicA-like mRNA interferase family)
MSKLPIIKPKELIRVLEKLGFFKHHQVGSHAQFKNPKGQKITVSIHSGKDLKRKTLKGIINDLEIDVEGFITLLKK